MRQTHLGTTPSGKKVYLEKLPHQYPRFSAEDHTYAAVLHGANRTGGGRIADLHRAAAAARSRGLMRTTSATRTHATKKSPAHDFAKAAKKANDQIYDLTHNKYFQSIPNDELFAIVRRAGFRFDPIEEEFILVGRDGKATWQLHDEAGREVNHMLVLQWHKMDRTGRYEVVAYVSYACRRAIRAGATSARRRGCARSTASCGHVIARSSSVATAATSAARARRITTTLARTPTRRGKPDLGSRS